MLKELAFNLFKVWVFGLLDFGNQSVNWIKCRFAQFWILQRLEQQLNKLHLFLIASLSEFDLLKSCKLVQNAFPYKRTRIGDAWLDKLFSQVIHRFQIDIVQSRIKSIHLRLCKWRLWSKLGPQRVKSVLLVQQILQKMHANERKRISNQSYPDPWKVANLFNHIRKTILLGGKKINQVCDKKFAKLLEMSKLRWGNLSLAEYDSLVNIEVKTVLLGFSHLFWLACVRVLSVEEFKQSCQCIFIVFSYTHQLKEVKEYHFLNIVSACLLYQHVIDHSLQLIWCWDANLEQWVDFTHIEHFLGYFLRIFSLFHCDINHFRFFVSLNFWFFAHFVFSIFDRHFGTLSTLLC